MPFNASVHVTSRDMLESKSNKKTDPSQVCFTLSLQFICVTENVQYGNNLQMLLTKKLLEF